LIQSFFWAVVLWGDSHFVCDGGCVTEGLILTDGC